jgi:uncharacterized membrane protein
MGDVTEECAPRYQADLVTAAALVYTGVGIALAASGVANAGMTLQKVGFNTELKKPLEQRRSYFRQRTWWLGLVLNIVAAGADFAALSLAPASIVSPTGSFGLACNVLMAWYFIGERGSWRWTARKQ